MDLRNYTVLAASVIVCLMSSCSSDEPKKEEPVIVKTEIKTQASDYFTNHEPGIQVGGVQMVTVKTPSGTFNIWTKTIGNNPKARVLLLNGGPGHTHEYMECFESFFPGEGIEMIYYDQLGCGNSQNPNNPSLWDLSRFVDEVEQIRVALKLNKDNFYILGHSWGGILGIEYALKHQNEMKGLIISNMMSSAIDYGKYSKDVLAKQMNPLALDSIRIMEKKGEFANPRYMELLLTYFYADHICRLPQWPEPLIRSFNKLNQSLYVTMQGPSEFGISGKLEKWDRSGDLGNLTIPTLTIGAKYDTMDPEHMKWMAGKVQKGTYLYCPNGSHMCMYDDQQVYMSGIIDFIKSVGL